MFARGEYSNSKFILRHQRKNGSGSDMPVVNIVTVSIFGASINNNVQGVSVTALEADYVTQVKHEIDVITKKIR